MDDVAAARRATDDESGFRDVRHTFIMNAFGEPAKNMPYFPCGEKQVELDYVLKTLKWSSNILFCLAVLEGFKDMFYEARFQVLKG